MKKSFFVFIVFFSFCTGLLSQGVFEYSVHVTGSGNAGLPDVRVWLEELNTGIKIWKYTDRMGDAVFYPPAGSWSLNLEGLPGYKEFDLQEGVRGQGSVTVFYDLAEIRAEEQIREKRKQIALTPIRQQGKTPSMPPADSCILKVKLLTVANRPVADIAVDVVSVKNSFILSKNTNRSGLADFIVPVGERYAIDVDGVKNFSLTRLLNRSGVITVSLEYEPTLITEIVNNDTVTQQITPETRATSSRSLFVLTVFNEDGGLLADDNVYLHEIGSNRVFRAKTDQNGRAAFLIPNGSKYLLHFDYARDVDVYNFTTVRGIGNTEAQIIYRPDPRLRYPEQYIPAPDELFYEEFQDFVTKQLPEPAEKVGLFSGWGNNKVNAGSRHAVLDIGISVTSDVEKVREISGVNLSFVIDRSGSMAGYNRIEALRSRW
ncbi:MAG: hypothetical protein JXA03_00730 [Bacteroidales bacterium]|nr:hypothetical protein [Bacteroidales bacterium]